MLPEKNKKSLNLTHIVNLLTALAIYLILVLKRLIEHRYLTAESFYKPATLFIVIISVSIIAVWHSNANIKWLTKLGYKEPIKIISFISVVAIGYAIICHGWLCEFVAFYLVGSLWLLLIIFALSYSFAKKVRSCTQKTLIRIATFETIVILGVIVLIASHA